MSKVDFYKWFSCNKIGFLKKKKIKFFIFFLKLLNFFFYDTDLKCSYMKGSTQEKSLTVHDGLGCKIVEGVPRHFGLTH